MTRALNTLFETVMARDVEIDLALAETAYMARRHAVERQGLQDEIERLTAQLAQADRKLLEMQTVLDRYMIEYESRSEE